MNKPKTALPAHLDQATPMQRLLDPRSIAFIGASADPKRLGGIAIDHLVNFGYAGAVYPVNPKYPEIHGFPCYADIESVPEVPDLVVLAIGANDVLDMLERCRRKGIKAAIVYAAGFAEEGEEGARRQRDLEAFGRDSGMVICGPNCMGLANFNTRAITAFATLIKDFPPGDIGHIALVTQSGNMSAVIYGTGHQRGLRFSQFINTGNEACLEFSSYLDFLAHDPETHVVIGYTEGLRDGQKFVEVADRFNRANKPLVLIKSGETEQGSVAAMSHTAALAGNHAINRAAFRQLGVMQARDPVHLVDLAYLAGFRGKRGGGRVAVASISGAMGGLLTDLLVQSGLAVPPLPSHLQQRLKDTAPELGMVANPIDLTGNLYNREGIAGKVFGALADAPDIDTVLVYGTGYLLDRIAKEVIESSRSSGRLFIAIDTGRAASRDELERAGVPVFTDAARAISAMATYLRWFDEVDSRTHWAGLREQSHSSDGDDRARQPLDEHQAKQVLSSYGVPICDEARAADARDAALAADRLGYPVAIKILSPDIPHKTEAGGVRLFLKDAETVRTASCEVMANAISAVPEAEIRGLLVQRMEQGVCELIVGVTRDPVFGLAMTVGLGGVFTEIFRDAAHRLLPVDARIALEMLGELKGYRLLTGYRGKPAADIDAACRAIAAVSRAALAMPEHISDVEINPLLVKEQGAVALDALILTRNDNEVTQR
ncbi:Protein acetyltransferase (plasmid) [Paraburkholderia caribensis MBA4]|uniref:Protein acetyltransferase n=1 Tax=Paraburkholderia caribensis MBA4 TaxID=1323664 RepID=A0A0P0RQ85_9BURK|nr:acetate--CoA ligase family protein [Paraburkholderia caribensis]ALL71134.1 Protein acetyltransferase [Paraburkholderia caribensis MBA4]